MTDAKPAPAVVLFRLPPARAEATIRGRAKVSANVILGKHAKERAAERGIYKEDILRVLRTGWIKGEPEKTELGEWKCKMIRGIKGNREVGVVTVILLDDRLFVKTVEWEDL
ncbi:MAG: DUF4258 domain-containing protein [Oricola sp.]|jgi:hypothetical protein|nr:DUF4258 domain-containing protein [Oricola sp.]